MAPEAQKKVGVEGFLRGCVCGCEWTGCCLFKGTGMEKSGVKVNRRRLGRKKEERKG